MGRRWLLCLSMHKECPGSDGVKDIHNSLRMRRGGINWTTRIKVAMVQVIVALGRLRAHCTLGGHCSTEVMSQLTIHDVQLWLQLAYGILDPLPALPFCEVLAEVDWQLWIHHDSIDMLAPSDGKCLKVQCLLVLAIELLKS